MKSPGPLFWYTLPADPGIFEVFGSDAPTGAAAAGSGSTGGVPSVQRGRCWRSTSKPVGQGARQQQAMVAVADGERVGSQIVDQDVLACSNPVKGTYGPARSAPAPAAVSCCTTVPGQVHPHTLVLGVVDTRRQEEGPRSGVKRNGMGLTPGGVNACVMRFPTHLLEIPATLTIEPINCWKAFRNSGQ